MRAAPPPAQQRFGPIREVDADGQPGHYYVTIRDERGRVSLALGPFTARRACKVPHLMALGYVQTVKHYVRDYRDSPWWSYGTARLPLHLLAPRGKLNDALGLP